MSSEDKRHEGTVRVMHVHAKDDDHQRRSTTVGRDEHDATRSTTHDHDHVPPPTSTTHAHEHAHENDHDADSALGSGGFPHEKLDAYRVALRMAAAAKKVADQIPRGHRSIADH